MAITNYSELKAEVIAWSDRGDQDLNIDNFILLAEQDMHFNPTKRLRLRDIELRSTSVMSITSRYLALPTGFKEMRSLRFDVTDKYDDLTFRTPQGLVRRDETGKPIFFAISSQIEFDILPDETYPVEMNYLGTPLPITEANPTNEILTSNPDIYLFGCLYKLFLRVVDSEQMITYRTMFNDAVKGANKTSRDGRFGPSPTAKVDGPTP